MELETIILAIIGGGVFGALASLIIAWWKRPKDQIDILTTMRKEYEENFKELLKERERVEAVCRKLNEVSEKLDTERKAREDEKRGEFASREKERQANDIRYKELEDKFDAYKKTSEYNASIMISQIGTLKNELEKSNRENLEFRKRLKLHDGQLNNLQKKVTGQLPPAKY